jgi:outer membrane lipoprotein SlyB
MFGELGLLLGLAAAASLAQQSPPVRVRGTIEAVDGATLTVKSRDNQQFYKVKVADDAVVRGLVPASPADIKANSFIGVSGLPQADGSQKALEIHIFPEAMRGTGEGHQPWDLVPGSTMTNATVAQMVKKVDGDEITVKYKGGEKKIVVLPQTRIVTFLPGDRSELKPGVKIFIAAARRKDDGTLEASSIAAGRDGLPPPM